MLSKVSLRNLARFACKPSTQTAWQRTHHQFLSQLISAQLTKLTQSYVNFFTSNQKASFSTIEQPKPQPDLDSLVDKVANQSWEEILQIIPTVASRRRFELDQARLNQFFKNIETKFLHEDINSASNDLLVELGYVFGMHKVGSQAFWEKLIWKVKDNIGQIDLHQVARFIYGTTYVAQLDSQFWDELEQVIQEQRIDVTVSLSGYLMPSIIRNMNRIQLRALKNQEHSENKHNNLRTKLEKLPLWNNLKDHAVAKIEEAEVADLVEISLALATVGYKDEGFWTAVQQRALELRDDMDEIQIASLVEVFGNVRQGGANFWQEMESYTLENFETLQNETLTAIVNGFATSGEGSFRFWNEISNHLLNIDLRANDLTRVVSSFGHNETLSDAKWGVLETKALEKMSEYKTRNIVELIMGFGKSGKGSQKFWNSIEEKVLSWDKLPEQAQSMLYVHFKGANKLTPDLTAHFRLVAPKIENALEEIRKANSARGTY